MTSAKKNNRKAVDWEAVEMRYRTGTESLRTIAASFDITEGAIRRRAKAEEWTRDLQKKVQQATEALLIRKSCTQDVRTEGQAIAVEAEMRSEVVIGHRAGLRRLRVLRDNLTTEIETVTDDLANHEKLADLLDESGPDENGRWKQDKLNERYRRVISLSGRVDDVKKLAEIDEKIRKGEREAFGIDKGEGESSPLDAVLKKLAKERAG
jgi:hypothetical protein